MSARRESSETASPLRDAGILVGRPLEGPNVLSRAIPFVLSGAIATIVAAVVGNVTHTGHLEMALVISVLIVVSIAVVPWERGGAYWQLAPLFAGLAAIALARDATGGSHSVLAALVMLPILWVGFYGTRSQMSLVLAGVAATLALPAVIQGPPLYPAEDAVTRSILWVSVGRRRRRRRGAPYPDVRRLAQGYRSTLDAAHVAFIAMDAAALIIEWNQAARERCSAGRARRPWGASSAR